MFCFHYATDATLTYPEATDRPLPPLTAAPTSRKPNSRALYNYAATLTGYKFRRIHIQRGGAALLRPHAPSPLPNPFFLVRVLSLVFPLACLTSLTSFARPFAPLSPSREESAAIVRDTKAPPSYEIIMELLPANDAYSSKPRISASRRNSADSARINRGVRRSDCPFTW